MLRPGQAVAVCVLALLTLGVLMVNSAGLSIDPREPFTIEGLLLSRSTIYAGLALVAMAVCASLPVRRLLPTGVRTDGLPRLVSERAGVDAMFLSPSWIMGHVREYAKLWPLWVCVLGMVAVLATVYVPGIERPRNGSHRWITLHLPGLDSIQPSELAKWGMVVLIAWYGARYAARMKSFWLGLVPGLVAIGAVAGVIVIEDLGTGALVVAASGVVLLAAGVRFWHLLILVPVPVAGAVLAIVTNPYRMDRIKSFMDPYLDPQGKGFHMIQSMTAVANGKLSGRGLGHGLQKFGYLPEDTTDFLFAVVCEELGVAGAAIVLFLMGALLWAVWMIVKREQVLVLKLIGLGVLSTIGIQAAINLFVVTGLGPTKGIALPLLSSGGTGWILTAGALGLVIAMDRGQRQTLGRTAFTGSSRVREHDGEVGMPALGAMAMGAAAATAGVAMAEVKPESRQAIVAEEMAAAEDVTAENAESAEGDDVEETVAADEEIVQTGEEVSEHVAATQDVEMDAALTAVSEERMESFAAAEVEIAAVDDQADDEIAEDVDEEVDEEMVASAEELASDGSSDPSELAMLDQPPSEQPKEDGFLFDLAGEDRETAKPEIVVRESAGQWLKTSEAADERVDTQADGAA